MGGPSLFVPVSDAAVTEVVGGKLDEDAVAGEDADEIQSDFSTDVGEDAMAVGQFDAEHRVRKRLHDRPFDFDRLFFGGCRARRLGLVAGLAVGALHPATTPPSHPARSS